MFFNLNRGFIICAAGMLLGISSCRQDAGNAEWDVDLLAPVLKTTFSLNDLVEDSLLVTNPDSSLKLVYVNDFSNLLVDTLLEIPDTSVVNELKLPITTTIQPGVDIITLSTETKYSLKDAQLVEVVVRSGSIEVELHNNLGTKVFIDYAIPSASLNGVSFFTTSAVEANSSIIRTFDLAGYHIDLTGLSGNSFNTLITSFGGNTAAAPEGVPVTINANQAFITITSTFSGLTPEYARGYFGSPSFSIENESTEFDFLKKIIDGQIGLEEVKLSLSLENGIGADGQITIGNITSVNTRTGISVNLAHEVMGTPINITRASEAWHNSGVVSPTFKSYVFDNSNSNIRALIENLPHRLDYSVDFMLNPLGNISSGNDFFYLDHNIKTNLELEVPLTFYADHLMLSDTLEFNADVGNAGSNINNGSFNIIADNSFPLSASLKLILLGDNDVKLDSLYSPTNIAAPALDANFKVIGSLVSALNIPFSSTTGDKLNDTRKINIMVTFDTPQAPQLLKIYSGYKMDIKIIGDFNYTLNQP